MPFKIAPYDACGFCRYLLRELECAFVAEDALAVAFVNHRQHERGATLVIPRQHRETILETSQAELASVYTLAKRMAHAAERAFGACGANIFQNNGSQAGQHVPHMHVHVVPRYPESDPGRLFRQQDFAISSMIELQHIAAALRAALSQQS